MVEIEMAREPRADGVSARDLIENELHVFDAQVKPAPHEFGAVGIVIREVFDCVDNTAVGELCDGGLIGVVDGEHHIAARGELRDEAGVEGARCAIAVEEQDDGPFA